jgi:hypothetical protein
MAGLRTSTSIVSIALKMRTEGMGIRASGRVLEKSHSTIMRWEKRVAAKEADWSPPALVGGDVTVEGDELYTRVGENLPPSESLGWTINFLERHSRRAVSHLGWKKRHSLV